MSMAEPKNSILAKFPRAPDFFGTGEKSTKSGYKRLSNDERINKSIEAAAIAADKGNPKLAQCLRTMQPCANFVIKALLIIGPIYEYIFKWCAYLYYVLPKNVLKVIFGLALCFFGGAYLTVFAAIEGFRKMGWERAYQDIMVLYEAYKEVEIESKKDDDQDKDGDGIADVDQMSPDGLLKRKTAVAMKAIGNPQVVQTAVGSLWAAYLAVLATLKMQFAQTTAIALGIAEMVKFPIVRAVSPLLAIGLGADLAHWSETIIDTTINFIAIVFAWYLQMIISAFYSGLRGGKYVAEGLFALLYEQGLLQKAPTWLIKNPEDPDSTYLDEVIMYVFFAAGFFTQLTSGFGIPFPINVILFPVTVLEWVLRWQVTFGAIPTTG